MNNNLSAKKAWESPTIEIAPVRRITKGGDSPFFFEGEGKNPEELTGDTFRNPS